MNHTGCILLSLTCVGLLPHDAVDVDGGEEGDARGQVGHAEPGAEHGPDEEVGDVEGEGGAVAVGAAHHVPHLVVDRDHEPPLDPVPLKIQSLSDIETITLRHVHRTL